MGAPHLVKRAHREGIALLVLRAERGFTIGALARTAGVSPTTITNAERGQTRLSEASARKLAGALGVQTEALIERPGEYRPTDDDSSLRRRRHQLGLSGRAAADAMGVSRMALMRAETGGRVHPRNAERIASFYGVGADEVVPRKRPSQVSHTTGEEAA